MSSSFTLAPGRLEAAGRSRGGQHAAQSRPPTPQRQSVLPGSPPDLQLSGVTLVRRVTQRSVPCKLQLSFTNAGDGLEYLRVPADASPPHLLGPEERGRGPAAAGGQNGDGKAAGQRY